MSEISVIPFPLVLYIKIFIFHGDTIHKIAITAEELFAHFGKKKLASRFGTNLTSQMNAGTFLRKLHVLLL